MKNEVKHTAHSSYRCEYHIVFAQKYKRKEIYGQLKKEKGEILRKLCNEKKVEIIEAEACPDHIHMLVSIPPYLSISQCSALFGNWGHQNRFGLGILYIAEDADLLERSNWTMSELDYRHENPQKVGFQYPTFLFDGEDILCISRTAFNGADNFNNANCQTIG